MLYCESCDYLKSASFKASVEKKCVCGLTGFVFHKNIEDYEMENHPCYDYPANKLTYSSAPVLNLKSSNLKIAQ
jgi:hypothetical protein